MPRMGSFLLVLSLASPGAARAAADPTQPASPPPSENRLSADQVEKILDEAARKRELAAMSAPDTGPAVHGEIGFSVGTGGYRSAFGTAIVPLSGNGVAILSLETSNFDHSRTVDYRER